MQHKRCWVTFSKPLKWFRRESYWKPLGTKALTRLNHFWKWDFGCQHLIPCLHVSALLFAFIGLGTVHTAWARCNLCDMLVPVAGMHAVFYWIIQGVSCRFSDEVAPGFLCPLQSCFQNLIEGWPQLEMSSNWIWKPNAFDFAEESADLNAQSYSCGFGRVPLQEGDSFFQIGARYSRSLPCQSMIHKVPVLSKNTEQL